MFNLSETPFPIVLEARIEKELPYFSKFEKHSCAQYMKNTNDISVLDRELGFLFLRSSMGVKLDRCLHIDWYKEKVMIKSN